MKIAIALAVGCVALVGCERPEQPRKTHEATERPMGAPLPASPRKPAGEKCLTVDPGAPRAEAVKKAVAVVHASKGSKVAGAVTFEETDAGLRMRADLEGLPQGKHGFHVHAFGDCSAEDASSAGPHFDFKGSFTHRPPGASHISGNLGDVDADASGKAHVEATIPDATLEGPFTIIGRSVVVHEHPNDPSKPPEGGAGTRIGCGTIGIEQR